MDNKTQNNVSAAGGDPAQVNQRLFSDVSALNSSAPPGSMPTPSVSPNIGQPLDVPKPLEPGQIVQNAPPLTAPITPIPQPRPTPLSSVQPPPQPSLSTTTPISSSVQPPKKRPPVNKASRWRRRVLVALAILILLGGGFILVKRPQLNNASLFGGGDVSSRFNNIKLPLDELARAGFNAIGGAKNLSINGQLRVSDSLVLAPIIQPVAPLTGQIFYDKDANHLAYYNGSRFVGLTDNTSNVVQSLGGSSGAILLGAGLSITGGALTNTGVLSLNNATTTTKGIASFNSANFTVTSGVVNTIQDINSSATPTFAGIITNNITPTGSLTIGSPTQSFLLQGNSSSTITATNGSNATTLSFQTPTANVTYRFPTLPAGTYDICSSIGNCAGAGGSVTAPGGGSANKVAKFSGPQTIVNSIITDDGTTVSVGGNFNVSGNTALSGTLNTSGNTSLGGTLSVSGGATIGGNLSLATGSQYQINSVQISSANLSNDANLAKLNGTQTFTGYNTFKNSTDSATSLQVQNAAGIVVLNADTTNGRIGINKSSPSYALDVTGDINTTTVYRIGGVTVCSGNSCTPAAGSSNYIQNGTTVQTSANFAIQSSAAANVGGLIKGASGQTADLLQLQNSAGTNQFNVSAGGAVTEAGALTVSSGGETITAGGLAVSAGGATITGNSIFKPTTNGTTSFQVQNAAGGVVLNADTTNSRIGIANAAPAYALDVTGDVNTSGVYRIGGTTICTSSGCTAASGSGNFIQNGTTVQTNANFAIQSAAAASVGGLIRGAASQTADLFDLQTSTPTTVFSVGSAGAILAKNTTNSLTAFQVQNAAGTTTVLDADTTNGRVGINTATPAVTLEVNGPLRLSGTSTDSFVTPNQGSSVPTKINIPTYDPGAFGQIVAMGVPQSAQTTARVMSLFDNRTVAHQPTLAVFSPSENDTIGFSWDGTNAPILKTSQTSIYLQPNSVNALAALSSGRVAINATSASYTLDVNGDTNVASGSVYRIGGTTVCSGTTCTPASGSTNYIQNGTAVQASANFAIQSAAAASVGGLIRGAAAQTADLFDLQTSTPTTVLSVSSSGSILQKTTTNSTTALQVQNASGTDALAVDTSNLRVMVGSSTAPDTTFMVAGNGTGFARIGTPDGCGANYTAISLSGAMSGCANYNLLSSPTDKTLYINRPTGASIIFRENNATQFTLLYGGAAQFQNTSDSTAALYVKNAAGTTTLLNADTTNGRVAINAASASYVLDVAGDINTSTVYRIGGTTVCSGTTCTPASGSNNYIRNGTTVQTSANFAIQSAATTSVGAVIKGIASQTADAFDIQDSSGVVTFSASTAGTVTVAPDSNATNIFDVQNATGSAILDVDTTNGRVGIGAGNSTPSEAADVVGNLKVKNATTPTKGLRLRTSGGTLDLEASGTNVVLSTWSGADFTGTQYSQITLNNDGTGMRFARGFTDAPATDSTTLIQLQNAAGTSTIFNLDSTNKRVGIMNTTPGFPLDVTGDVNTTTTYKIGGTTVCSGTTCTPASGSTNYIQNGTAVQTSANFAIQSAATTSVTAVIKGLASQSADLLDIQDSTATNMLTISPSGVVTLQNNANNTNAFRVRAAASTTYFDVDTVNGRVGVGSGNFAPSEALDTIGNIKVKDAATPTKGQRLRTSGGALDFEGSGASLQFSTWSGADFTGTQYNQFALKNDGTAVAFNRSITVQSASSTVQAAIFKNAVGQTADLFQAQDSGGATMFKITGSGTVGIFPDVDSGTLFQVQNAAGTVNAFVVSTNNATAGANAANSTLVVAKDSGTSRSINAAGTINASGADYAEYFGQAIPGQIQPGQLVCLTPQRLARACNSSAPGMLIGAVSTHPGYVGNDIFDPAHPNNTVLVGLLGQIRVKVSASNGPIHAGDMLTLSSQSGVAVKATGSGMTVGSALEDASSDGEVDAYIHVGYYSPPVSQTVQPTYSQPITNSSVNFASVNVTGPTKLASLTVTGDATISGQLVVSNLSVGQQLVINGHIVTGGNSPTIGDLSGCNTTESLDGTDTAGIVTITVAQANCTSGKLGRITFSTPFTGTPKISLTPANSDAASMQYFVDSGTTSANGFDITMIGAPAPKTYKWYYHVIQ